MFNHVMNFGLSEEIEALRDTVRRFAADEIAPRAAEIDASNEFPMDLWEKMGALGLHGITVPEADGGVDMGYLAHCIAIEEISRASASVGLSYGAHSNLCVNQINRWGTAAQKAKYLPKLISGENVGALAMSEPGAGSDVVSMKLRAERRNDGYLLNGNKMWITNGPDASTLIVYAKSDPDAGPKGITAFLVERGMEGFSTPETHNKWSLRASATGELIFDNVKVPKENLLPNKTGLGAPLGCLDSARYGIAWGAIGAAMDCYDTALRYSKERIQFGKPIGQFQLQQKKLAEMITEITKAQLLTWRLGVLRNEGRATSAQISMAKRNNVDMAINIAREARQMLGGMGITGEYSIMRHSMNLESVITYEGTHDIHLLITGLDITGLNAFK